jgi:parallel beta-helix repeat protein
VPDRQQPPRGQLLRDLPGPLPECEVRGNRIRSNATREADSGNGIHLWDVERIQVTRDNRISGHRDGIYLEFARGVIIRGNTSEENLRYGLHFMFSDDSFYQDNTFRRTGPGWRSCTPGTWSCRGTASRTTGARRSTGSS